MSKNKVKLNRKGFVELRRSAAVQADLDRRARNIAREAAKGGGNFYPSTISGKRRARASVITADAQARRRQSKEPVLQRALNAGR